MLKRKPGCDEGHAWGNAGVTDVQYRKQPGPNLRRKRCTDYEKYRSLQNKCE